MDQIGVTFLNNDTLYMNGAAHALKLSQKRGVADPEAVGIGASEGIRTLETNGRSKIWIFPRISTWLASIDTGKRCNYCWNKPMASLRLLPNSPYWIACYTLQDGTRTQRSTKVPVKGVNNPKLDPLKKRLSDALGITITQKNDPGAVSAKDAKDLAQWVADQFEAAERAARDGRLIERQVRKTLADTYERTTGDRLMHSSTKEFLASWLSAKQTEAGEKTYLRYAGVVKQFLAHLGKRAEQDLAHLRKKDIEGFRDALASRLTASTANIAVKILRSALKHAFDEGLIDVNEASRVKLLDRGKTFQRRAFTIPELKRVLGVANEEWRGMILCGLYTGLRLGDVAVLTWANLDLVQDELTVHTQKTDRVVILPLNKRLKEYFETLESSDDPSAPLFPEAFAAKRRSNYGGTLSNQFYGILVAAGLAPKRSHEAQGKGRSARRTMDQMSFHCLRHTATTLLKKAGASDVVARDIIGHDSAAVSRNYTHIDVEAKRKAVDAMPDVLA